MSPSTPIPNVGDRVRLVLFNDSIALKGPWAHLFNSTERLIGNVVRIPAGLGEISNAFAVRSSYNLHIIRMHQLLSINGERVRGYSASTNTPPPSAPPRTFVIAGSKAGITYAVTHRKGAWVCNCTGFGYRRTCRHVAEAQRQAPQAPQAPTHPGALVG